MTIVVPACFRSSSKSGTVPDMMALTLRACHEKTFAVEPK